MYTFKSYLYEGREKLATAADVLAAIQYYDKLPEIMNADLNHIKEQAGYRFRDADKELKDYLLSKDDMDKAEDDLYYGLPMSYTSFGKMKKLVAKCKDPMIQKLAKNMLDVWEPISDGIKALKGKAVKVATKRAEVAAKVEKEVKKKRGDSKAMIKVLESHRNEYLKRAKEEAEKYAAEKIERLKKKNWDLDQIIPKGNRSREWSSVRSLYINLTDAAGIRASNGPDIRKYSLKRVKNYVNGVVESAGVSYDQFIAKMVDKVGEPVVSAELNGSIWTNAELKVTTESGDNQIWITRMIINMSKYQKFFNQFPTRRKK